MKARPAAGIEVRAVRKHFAGADITALEDIGIEDRSGGGREARIDPVAAAALREALDALGEFATPEWSAWLEASLGSHLIAQEEHERARQRAERSH